MKRKGTRAILTYHSIDASGSVISIDPQALERQLDWLASGKVRVIPLASFLTVESDVDTVALTFDDGFANFAESAAQLLLDRNLPATIFIVTDRAGGTNSWERQPPSAIPTLPLLSWDEIRVLDGKGFDIGGHGATHASLRHSPADLVSREIDECGEVLEASLGKPPLAFAFPFGHHDERAVELVSQRFPIAVTTRFDLVRPGDTPHALPRLDMYYFRHGRMLERWGTPAFSAFISVRKAGRTMRAALQPPPRRPYGG